MNTDAEDLAALIQLCDLFRSQLKDNNLKLPLRLQKNSDLQKWDCVITGLLMNVGIYEAWREKRAVG